MTDARSDVIDARRSIGRRLLLAGAATAGAGLMASDLAKPAIAGVSPHIKMTLPWLPQGSQFFAFVARNRGYWKSRGLDVEIVRGFGSTAAIQTIVQGQCQAGIIAAPTVILSAAQGLQTRVFGIAGYDSTMGVLTNSNSAVKTLKDLEGRRLGSTLTSAEVPFLEPFLQKSGVDTKKITRVSLQANVLDSALANGQVDAISAFATTDMPSLLVQKLKPRFFPYSGVGIKIYSNALTTTPEFAKANRSMIADWVDGMNDALKFCMLNFDEAVDIFVREVPEVRMSDNGRLYTRFGAGLFMETMLRSELKEHGIGWSDPDSINNQIDLVMKYATSADARRPDGPALFTNELAGKIKLSNAEWTTASKTVAEFSIYMNA